MDPSVNSNLISQPNQPTKPVVPAQAVTSQVAEPESVVTPTMSQAVGQAVQSGVVPTTAIPPLQPISGGLHKEQLMTPVKPPETVTVVEVGKDKELGPEVESWIEHLKQDGEIKLPEPIKDDLGNIVLAEAPAQVIQDKIVVPMTQSGTKQGMKKPVTESARWLSEWINRLVKMLGSKVAFRKSG